MDLFVQKYKEDPAFAVRVDASVVKILTLKFKSTRILTLKP